MAKSFSLQVREFLDKAKEDSDKIFKSVVMQMGTRIIMMSPVDTGRFRGNWNVGINSQDLSVDLDILDPDGSRSRTELARGVDQIKVGDIVWLTNNLPYAVPLEYGHSTQAPGGMVRVTVLEFNSYISKAVANLDT